MKRLLSSFLVTVIFTISTYVLAQEPFKIPKAVTKCHNQINVGVFPQVELISIVQTIIIIQTIHTIYTRWYHWVRGRFLVYGVFLAF